MLSELQKIETYKVLGKVAMGGRASGSKHKVAWAMSLLEQGVETNSLAILATLLKPVNEFEADDYFNRVLIELGIHRPGKESAIEGYAKVLTKEVFEGRLSPKAGASLIYEANVQLDYPAELYEFTILYNEWYCKGINSWSKEQRREEIVKACKEVYEVLNYPDIFTA